MLRTRLTAFALLLGSTALVAGAAPSPPTGSNAEQLRLDTQTRAREEIQKAIEVPCAGRCKLSEVTVTVGPLKPPASAMPGFESLTADVKGFVVQKVDVNLLVDKKLTNDFRAGLRKLVQKQLDAQSLPHNVHEEMFAFPEPPPDKPQMLPQYPQPPAPRVEPERERPRTEPQVVYVQPHERTAWQIFLENLPLLMGLLVCAGVVWFTLRQYARILEGRTDARKEVDVAAIRQDADEKKPEVMAAAAAAARRESDAIASSLQGRLTQTKSLARAVMRDLVQHGASADAALAVSMLGPAVLDGVRGDPECRVGLDALDDFLSQRAPDDTIETRRRLCADLERRILRVQVARGGEPSETAFAYLRDVNIGLFVRLLGEEPPEAQALILRHAPAPLTRAFVERQAAGGRERLVGPLLDTTATPRVGLEALARSFQEKLARHLLPDHDHADPIGELLQSAPSDERRRLLATLKGDPEALDRALGSFVADETLHALDGEVLATAVTRLDTATAALFAGSLDEVGRKRLLSSLPMVTAQSIAEEAEVSTASAPRRAAARRLALAAIRRAVDERGIDLADMNRRAMAKDKEVAS